LKIGIDFDNTVARYDAVFADAAIGGNLVPADFSGGKTAVKRRVMALSDGETEWMRLQGRVYGALMGRAELMPGLDAFLGHCRAAGVDVHIISHKTEFGHFDTDRVNLREAAMAWMTDKGFFAADGFAIPTANVFFGGDRTLKIERIRSVACDYFIDDLEVVLRDPAFPVATVPILFGRKTPEQSLPALRAYDTWSEIDDVLFG